MMAAYTERLRYKCADLEIAAHLAERAGDYDLASECLAAANYVRGALDGSGQLAGLYRLGCWMKGEEIRVNGVTFTCDKETGYWTSGVIERGLLKGEPAVSLADKFFIRWMRRNNLVPIIQESGTKNKEEK